MEFQITMEGQIAMLVAPLQRSHPTTPFCSSTSGARARTPRLHSASLAPGHSKALYGNSKQTALQVAKEGLTATLGAPLWSTAHAGDTQHQP